MQATIKPFIISNPFLIEKSPLGQILRGFIEELCRYHFKPTIVCMDEKSNKEECNSFMNIIALEQSHFIKALVAVIRRIIPDLTYLPDTEYYSWGKKACRYSLPILNNTRHDYIHTISFSCACHLMGYELKQKTGLPWVAQFYDPWYENPDRRFKTRFFKKIDLKQEKLVADNADLIIIYTRRLIESWINRYGPSIKEKILFIPLSINGDLPQIEHHIRNGKLKMVHIGNFQLKRTSEPLIKALSLLREKYNDLSSLIDITFVGNVTTQEIELINQLKLSDCFTIVGRKSEQECYLYYQKADIFLAIDAPFEKNIFYPSKVMKYFYFDKPILGITPNGSVLSEELDNSGHLHIDNNNVDGIVSYLIKALTDYESLLKYNHSYAEQFKVFNVVRTYVKAIDEKILH